MAAPLAPRQSLQALSRLSSGNKKRLFSTVVDDRLGSILPSGGAPSASSVLHNAVNTRAPRNSWSKDDIREIYNTPLMELAFKAVRGDPSLPPLTHPTKTS